MGPFKYLAWAYLASVAVAQSIGPDLLFPREPYSPYAYPSPNATGIGWQVAFNKAQQFVAQMTIEEKVGVCTGGYPVTPGIPTTVCQGGVNPIPRLNFSGLCYSDSDTGLGNGHSHGTGFPPGVTAASTWNRELLRARGFAIATEFKAKGIHAVLGPVLALSRTAGGGTNFEGFGGDPFLIGVAGYETVIGEQAAGVQAEPKQYLGYDGQQYNRTFYSSNIDDKTLHEIEVWPYAEAVRAGAVCVMTSYPFINNSQTCQNGHLLNDILKTHLGFQGYTQSDWGAIKAGVATILAGMDQNMPGMSGKGNDSWSYFGANYTQAVQNGTVPEWRLDDAATRIMAPYFFLGQDRNYPKINLEDDPHQTIVNAQRQRHRTLVREIAAAGTVLLKNTQGKMGLPLYRPTTITLFGHGAGPNSFGPNQYNYGSQGNPNDWDFPTNPLGIGIAQGTVPEGGGSGSTFYPRLVDPLSAIQERAAQDMTLVDWSLTTNMSFAAVVAARGTVCLPFVTSYSGEARDRNLTLLFDGDDLIQTVADNCDNTIPVVQSVGPVDMEKWVEHPNVTAIIWANLAGEELGHALVDILYGVINPSGRLVYTIARNTSDYAQPDIVTEPQPYPQINYTEGVSVDYRLFEKNSVEPRYWFGHGLSYSNFTYSDLQVQKTASLATAVRIPLKYIANAPGGDTAMYDVAVVASLNVTNTGPYDGTEIVQLYLQMPMEAGNPTKILRGFVSVAIRDSETQTVYIYLTRKDISYWNVVTQTWTTANGTYSVLVGASANDIRLSDTFTI